LNEALKNFQIQEPKTPAKAIDPFKDTPPSSSSKKCEFTVTNLFESYRHLAVLTGADIDKDEVLLKLQAQFGQCVRLKPVNSTTYILVFSSSIDGGDILNQFILISQCFSSSRRQRHHKIRSIEVG
jgi:hypothetical protein